MSTLSEVSQSGLGWVYPPQPRTEINVTDEIIGVVNGITQLVEDQDYIDVAFGTEQPNEDWVMLEVSLFNITDSTPINVWPGVVTSKTATGFRLQLNGTPDSSNYYLSWSIRGVFGYYLSGPVSGPFGSASNQFTVRLTDDSSLTGTVVITPSDGGVGGSFTPSTVSLTAAAPSATFTYTPSSYGARSISVTNNRGLINPAQIGFTATVSNYTLSGPSGGIINDPSTNFTVALPVGGTVLGTVTVTPDDGSDGAFTPTSVALTTASPSQTFIYTPASAGAKSISVTDDAGLTDPSPVTYTVTSPSFLDNFTGTGLLSDHVADTGQGWDSNGLGSTITLLSGLAYNSGGAVAAGSYYAQFTPASADQEASLTIAKGSISGSPEIGLFLRSSLGGGTPTGYMLRFAQGSGFQFYRITAGPTFTQIGSNVAGSLSNGDVIRATISGTGATVTLTLFVNGVQVATADDTAGGRITSNGKVGVYIYDATASTGALNYQASRISSP